jgi:hypothetical protein
VKEGAIVKMAKLVALAVATSRAEEKGRVTHFSVGYSHYSPLLNFNSFE